MSTALDRFMQISPVVPVVVIEDVAHAVTLARTLVEGGVAVIEVTLRSDAALASIATIAREVPEITLAVGTVLNPQQLQSAKDAGATLAISPGIDRELIDASARMQIPLLPGIASASELMLGLNAGLTRFKLFPATAINGLELAKAFAGPFPQARFCPTGGISLEAAPSYLAQTNILCIGASWLASAADIRAARWDSIRANAQRARNLRKDS
jgi:2-dehydro-3-deoxyphosphogluconate aldolase/(4S)-4-hydroxy-2-oxoglutarate aldolase